MTPHPTGALPLPRATSPGPDAPQRAPWAVLVAVLLPLFALMIDFYGVVVLLPAIGDELGATTAQLGWIVNAFALASATPVLALGRVSDLVGRRRVLIAGMVLFAASSVLGGLAPSAGALIAGRVGQGIGTACFFTASLALVDAAFPPARRALAIGLWGGIGGMGSAVGPLVGGVIGQTLSWRWFFGLSVVIMAVATPLVLRFVPESRPGGSRTVDGAGFVLVTLGLLGVVYGLQEASTDGFGDPFVTGAMVGGAALLVAFVWWELRAPEPIVHLGLFRDRAYLGASGVAFLSNWAFGVTMFFLTIYLQDVLDEDALTTGLVFIAYSLPFAVLGILSGPIQRALGPRGSMALGQLLIGAGFVVFIGIDPTSGLVVVLAGLALNGLGQGLAFNISNSASLARVPDAEAGVGSGMVTTIRSVGLALGVAATSLVAAPPQGADAGAASFDRALTVGVVMTLIVTGLGLAAALAVPRRGASADG